MPAEIEHRYLLSSLPAHRGELPHKTIKQGYLDFDPDNTVRVRIKGDKAYHTTKGRRVNGVAREDEYEISMEKAEELFKQCDPAHIIEKIRYESLEKDGHIWEIDVFQGKLHGLVIAEVELLEENERYVVPAWVDGPNITNHPGFNNSALATQSRNQVIRMVQAAMSSYADLYPKP